MEVLAFENTRLTSLFQAARPEGQLYLPQAVAALLERYKFASFPSKIEELSAEHVAFRHGVFNGFAIDSFDIYGDGIVVASKSPSDLLDEFVADISVWMEEKLALKKVETFKVNKLYDSHIIVRSSAHLLNFLESLNPIRDMVVQALKASNGMDLQFHPIGFGFAPDATTIVSMKPVPFRVERRAAMPFEANIYYSSAPLPTKDHVAILERLEKLAG